MLLRAVHRTVYRYRTPAFDSHNELRLMPLSDACQTCEAYELVIRPGAAVHAYQEPGGTVHHFGIREPHFELEVLSQSTVETHLANPYDGLNLIEDDWNAWTSASMRQSFAEYLTESPFVSFSPAVEALARALVAELRAECPAVGAFLVALSERIHALLDYQSGLTNVHTTLDEVLELKAGVCQDFAHLMLAVSRLAGIPARYVSGYLFGDGEDPMRGDHATHAWVECPLRDGSWLGIDPTNNLLANDHYIKIHTGRDYSEVTPTRGVYVGTPATSLEVQVWVERAETYATR
jgi:transglutaminase-like putative cysteine protease